MALRPGLARASLRGRPWLRTRRQRSATAESEPEPLAGVVPGSPRHGGGALANLEKLHAAFTAEARRRVKTRPGDSDSDSDSDADPDDADEGADQLSKQRLHHEGTVQLAGEVAAPNGGQTVAVPGYGRGVPPSTDITSCVVLTMHVDEPRLVLTAAGDGEVILWAPSMGWARMGAMQFHSVFTRSLEAQMARLDAPKEPSKVSREHAAKLDEKREAEQIRRELEERETQSTFLDPQREDFISKEMHTTVLREVSFNVSELTYRSMQEAANLLEAASRAGIEEKAVPNTPRGLLQMLKQRGQRKRKTMMMTRKGQSSSRNTTQQSLIQGGAPPAESVIPAATVPRSRAQVTCLAVHPQIPRVVAGIGDGQVAVYHIFVAHGHRTPMLNQTQCFDAARGVGDVATAAYVPLGPLAQEGAQCSESFVVGFQSGRVAVFKVLFPGSLSSQRPGTGARSDASQPLLTNVEPLLMEHYHCKRPVQAISWHPVLGICSVGADGKVVIVDTTGAITCSIQAAAGVGVHVTAAALSVEHESIAVGGHQAIHLWNCFSQARLGVLVPPGGHISLTTSVVLAVHFLATRSLLISAHEARGEVRLWDISCHQQIFSVVTDDCPRATCATWDPLGNAMLVYGAMGVAQWRLCEDSQEPASRALKAQRGVKGRVACQEQDLGKLCNMRNVRLSTLGPSAPGG